MARGCRSPSACRAGLQFDTSYTWSKSLDTNSLNSSGFAIQDSYDIAGEYGPSDFDARHRFVVSAIYDLPFTGHALVRDWQVAAVVQAQSGNPVNIVTTTAASTACRIPFALTSSDRFGSSVRPISGSIRRRSRPSTGFGNLGRNAVAGPAFYNTDLSIVKTARLGAGAALQFRVDVFDLFNHPNFGPPGNIVGSPRSARSRGRGYRRVKRDRRASCSWRRS
jgi:hypothetical protein